MESIRQQIEEATSDYDKEKLQERVAKLSGGVAVIKVGASTEIEMKEKKARVEDALHATRAAVEEGVVPGGGVALVRAQKALLNLEGANEDQTIGIKILARAIEEPLRQIVENAGEDAAVILNRVKEGKGSFGYNAATGEFGDMIEAGILDPTKVTRLALQNSASVSGLLLTTEVMIAEAPKDDDHGHGMPQGGWAAWAAWTCKCLNEIRHPESVIYGPYADRMDGSWRKPRPIRKRRGTRPPISAQYSNPASAGFFLTCDRRTAYCARRMTHCRSGCRQSASQRVQQSAPRVAAASGFVAEACERDPALLASLIDSGDLETPRCPRMLSAFFRRARRPGRPVRNPMKRD